MTVQECIDSYKTMCKDVFADEGFKAKLKMRKWKPEVHIKGAFDHRILEAKILDCIKDHIPSCKTDDDARKVLLNDGDESACKV